MGVEVDWGAVSTITSAIITVYGAVYISRNWIDQKNSVLLSDIAKETYELTYPFSMKIKSFQNMVYEYEFTTAKKYPYYSEKVKDFEILSNKILSNLELISNYLIEIGKDSKKNYSFLYFEDKIHKILANEVRSFHNSFAEDEKKYENFEGLNKKDFLKKRLEDNNFLIGWCFKKYADIK